MAMNKSMKTSLQVSIYNLCSYRLFNNMMITDFIIVIFFETARLVVLIELFFYMLVPLLVREAETVGMSVVVVFLI